MCKTIHIINGDGAGGILSGSGISGDVLICRDLLYDGVRSPGWPDDSALLSRAQFLENLTGGGIGQEAILKTLRNHYQQLLSVSNYARIVLWFDGCLCDQAMLAHILVCLQHLGISQAELLCIDAFPGIEPFHGIGQLQPVQLASLYDNRKRVTEEQFEYSMRVDTAFATQNVTLLAELAQQVDAPLPLIPAAASRWLREQPDPETGLGRLEFLVLMAIRDGRNRPGEIFSSVASADQAPQFWGDITLWQKINSLAERTPPLVCIEGPSERLPQWGDPAELQKYRIFEHHEDSSGSS